MEENNNNLMKNEKGSLWQRAWDRIKSFLKREEYSEINKQGALVSTS